MFPRPSQSASLQFTIHQGDEQVRSLVTTRHASAGGGIRTLEPLRDEVLSLTPLTRLGDPRVALASPTFALRTFNTFARLSPVQSNHSRAPC